MVELEKQAYLYSVNVIGYARSLEHQCGESGQKVAARLKQAGGQVYQLLTDCLEAEANEDFAGLFRQSREQAALSLDYLNQSQPGQADLQEQKASLRASAQQLLERMDQIESKFIY